MRPGEDLARGHVALAVGVDPRAARRRPASGRCPRPGCGSRCAGASRSISPAWKARSSPHAATGSSRSRNSARLDEGVELARAHPRLLGGGGRRPQRDRPALGAAAARAAAPRPGRAGQARRVDAGQRVGVVGGLDAQRRVDARAPRRARPTGRRRAARRAAARQKPSDCPGSVDAQQRPGLALEHLALQRQQQRRGERARAIAHLLARLDLEAVVGQQPREARRRSLTAPPCPGSARRGARAAPRGSSAAPPARRSGSARAAPSGA